MTSLLHTFPDFITRLLPRKLPDDYLTAKLEKASQGDICPICTLDGEARYSLIWSLLWEGVTDPKTRDEFIRAGGLCHQDNWSMVDIARKRIKSSLGVAILYEHLSKVIARTLHQKGGKPPSWIDTNPWAFRLGQGCPACGTGHSATNRSGRRLIMAAMAGNPSNWLEQGFPLCYQHLRSLSGQKQARRSVEILLRLQSAGIHSLQSAMDMPELKSSQKPGRLEAALFPNSPLLSIPENADRIFHGAALRCPVCLALGVQEGSLLNEWSNGRRHPSPELCRGHYVALADTEPDLGRFLLTARVNQELSALNAHAEVFNEVPCVVCQARLDSEEAILSVRVPEWAGTSGPKDLLCLHHLGCLFERTSASDLPRLLDAQKGKMHEMITELGDFIAMHDYRSPVQPSEGPDSPYRWALRFFTSEPSIMAPILIYNEHPDKGRAAGNRR